MRVPPITPVLTGQSRVLVCAVVTHAVDEMGRAAEWRTPVWLAAKALEWLHFNAGAFVGAGSEGEGVQRRAFQCLWRAVDAHLSKPHAAEMRRLSDMLAGGQRPSQPETPSPWHLELPKHHITTRQNFIPRVRQALDLFAKVLDDDVQSFWRAVVVSRIFDLLLTNLVHLSSMPVSLRAVVKRKLDELGEEWPFFGTTYARTAQ